MRRRNETISPTALPKPGRRTETRTRVDVDSASRVDGPQHGLKDHQSSAYDRQRAPAKYPYQPGPNKIKVLLHGQRPEHPWPMRHRRVKQGPGSVRHEQQAQPKIRAVARVEVRHHSQTNELNRKNSQCSPAVKLRI